MGFPSLSFVSSGFMSERKVNEGGIQEKTKVVRSTRRGSCVEIQREHCLCLLISGLYIQSWCFHLWKIVVILSLVSVPYFLADWWPSMFPERLCPHILFPCWNKNIVFLSLVLWLNICGCFIHLVDWLLAGLLVSSDSVFSRRRWLIFCRHYLYNPLFSFVVINIDNIGLWPLPSSLLALPLLSFLACIASAITFSDFFFTKQ